jgi:hypothetical protein
VMSAAVGSVIGVVVQLVDQSTVETDCPQLLKLNETADNFVPIFPSSVRYLTLNFTLRKV